MRYQRQKSDGEMSELLEALGEARRLITDRIAQ